MNFLTRSTAQNGSSGINITIHHEEIEMFCTYTQEKVFSIQLILNLLGAPNMDYVAMNVDNSFQCLAFCSNQVIKFLKESKQVILFFKHRKNTNSNILIVATKQPKGKGVRECIVFMTVILWIH